MIWQNNKFTSSLDRVWLCLGVALAITLAGCSKSDETLRETFIRTQSDIVSPDGMVVPETVVVEGDVQGDYVRYQTDQGDHWRLKATKGPNGYTYSEGERLPPPKDSPDG